MTKSPTKAELIQKNAELTTQVGNLSNELEGFDKRNKQEDEDMRREISKTLCAPYQQEDNDYGYSRKTTKREQVIYTWFEIFREMGKLLERKDYADVHDVIKEIRLDMGNLSMDIECIKNPPQNYERRRFPER